MASFNKCILVGNLTRDPEMYHSENDNKIANFDLAVNNPTRDEEVLFIRCVAFGKLAEIITTYLNKGSAALFEGRLVLDRWTTTEGENRQQIKLYVSSMQMLGGKPSQDRVEPDANRAPKWYVDDYDI